MRGPGEAPGSFAFESAMDELASALCLDPVELRLRNLPCAGDPQSGKPWTSFNLAECWRRGADAFGWAARHPRPGASLGRSKLPGDELVGWGCATAAYPANRRKASAAAALLPDGMVEVKVASHDAGHGTYTALTILAADELNLPPERIRVMLGDTCFPEAPTSGGSSSLASAGPAVIAACQALKHRLAGLSVADTGSLFAGHSAEHLVVAAGRITLSGNAAPAEDWLGPLRRGRLNRVEVTAHADAGQAKETHGTMSFGAHFVEVRVHARLRSVRVTRYVGVYDVGRVLAPNADWWWHDTRHMAVSDVQARSHARPVPHLPAAVRLRHRAQPGSCAPRGCSLIVRQHFCFKGLPGACLQLQPAAASRM